MATIRKRKDKWEVQIRRMGLRPISKSFIMRKDAEAWARYLEVQADRADLPTDRRVLQRVTLGELVQRYRNTVSVKKRSHDKERFFLQVFLAHSICCKRLSEVSTTDFAEYRDHRLASVKPTSLKRELAPIRHLFEIARHEWGLPLKENPLDKLQLKASDQRRERRLKPGELNSLLEAAGHCRNKLIKPIILLAVETGMRRGEILSIRYDHLDLRERALLIPETKTGRARTIPLNEKATDLLLKLSSVQLSKDQERLFPISANCLRLAWERICKRAGVSDLHFHDLRHEALSRLFEAGLTGPEVMSISGHRSIATLGRYAHAGERKAIAAKLAATANARTWFSIPLAPST
jgi:integrase